MCTEWLSWAHASIQHFNVVLEGSIDHLFWRGLWVMAAKGLAFTLSLQIRRATGINSRCLQHCWKQSALMWNFTCYIHSNLPLCRHSLCVLCEARGVKAFQSIVTCRKDRMWPPFYFAFLSFSISTRKLRQEVLKNMLPVRKWTNRTLNLLGLSSEWLGHNLHRHRAFNFFFFYNSLRTEAFL